MRPGFPENRQPEHRALNTAMWRGRLRWTPAECKRTSHFGTLDSSPHESAEMGSRKSDRLPKTVAKAHLILIGEEFCSALKVRAFLRVFPDGLTTPYGEHIELDFQDSKDGGIGSV